LVRGEDDALLCYEEEDGESVQPSHFVPIVPMVLINGQDGNKTKNKVFVNMTIVQLFIGKGVGTGWSSSIPPHHPLQVVDAVLAKLEGKEIPKMTPWFIGYKLRNLSVFGFVFALFCFVLCFFCMFFFFRENVI
jgi:DNA topoisomerase-2